MKRLLILTMLTATTISSAGCCGMCGGMGGCFARRNRCEPMEAPCESCEQQQTCDPCMNGAAAGPAMGAPMMTAPGTMVMPGPATYSSSYLPR